MNVTAHIRERLDAQERANELLLKGQKGVVKDKIKAMTSSLKTVSLLETNPHAADSLLEVDHLCPLQHDRRRCRAPAPAGDPAASDKDAMAALLEEAFRLQQEHEALNTRHEAAGQVI